MKRESVNKFDLEAAFKALDEVEVPAVKGIRSTRENLQEKFTKKLVTEVLVEDYFDVGDTEELEQAQDERDAEIAKAKLARIEKIVDLEAETEEDLLPSYVGKLIVQCPQCMTLFYKKEEDIEKSEENPEIVNLNEPCQHCGNDSGYTLIGKVGSVGEDEAAQYDTEDFENELNLDFEEETAEAEDVEETAEEMEEVATEGEEEVDLAPVEDEESDEEEEVKESLTEATIYITKAEMAKLDKEVEEAQKEVAKYKIPMKRNSAGESEPDFEAVPEDQREAAKKAHDRYQKALKARPSRSQNIIKYTDEMDESLVEGVDKELEAKLKAHNDYVEYLKKMISQEEDALGKADNEFVKKAIQRRLDAFKADLEEALPAALKDEVAIEELPTPEEADMKNAAENKEDKKEKKESLTEDVETERKLAAEEASLEKSDAEAPIVEAAGSDVVKALDALEAELMEGAELTEAKYNVSDTDFKAMLNNPVFNEGCEDGKCEKDLEEDLAPVEATPFEKAADAIEKAGSELTPEEQKLEDEELANETPVEEKLEEDAGVGVLPAPVNPLGGVASLLKRKLSSTEVIAKELAAHPLFKGLSVRTIQRTLLPYYIENMGKDNLTTEAVVDFFEYEGFAIYVLGNLDSIEEAAGKELLKADVKFIKALEEYAKKYDMIPESEKDFEAGETRFDYLYDIIIESAPKGEGLKETLAELINIYNNLPDTYTEAVESETKAEEVKSEADIWEVVEDLDEAEFNKLTEQYLTEVYSNVQSFETTGCSLQDNKLVVEGAIKFVSGKTKNTTFIYEAKKNADKIILEGLNADFASTKAFVLNCKLDTANCLIVESLSYNYMINNTLVEGLLK